MPSHSSWLACCPLARPACLPVAFVLPCSASSKPPALAASKPLLLPFPCCCAACRAARRPKAAKAEIRLTPGKGVQDLTCTVEELVDQVVKACQVGAALVGVLGQMAAEMLGVHLGRQMLGSRWRPMEA